MKSILFVLFVIPLLCFPQKGILGLPSRLEKIEFGMDRSETAQFLKTNMGLQMLAESEDITFDYFEFDSEPYEFGAFYFCDEKLSDVLFMRSFNDKYEALSIFYRLAAGIDKNYVELPPPNIDQSNTISYDGFFNGMYTTKEWEKEGTALKMSLTLMVRMIDTSNPFENKPYTPECDYTLHIRYTNTSFSKRCP